MSILKIKKLKTDWQVSNPFLCCRRIKQLYPQGNTKQGLEKKLIEKKKKAWQIFEGERIPGFPKKSLVGAEHITLNIEGTIEFATHSENTLLHKGDVFWMLGGEKTEYSELFPLTERHAENPLECIDIELLQEKNYKEIKPDSELLNDKQVPKVVIKDMDGGITELDLISGDYDSHKGPKPPENSIVNKKELGIRIWHVKMQSNTQWRLPENLDGSITSIYFYSGSYLEIDWEIIESGSVIELMGDVPVNIYCGEENAQFIILSGKPIEDITEKEIQDRIKQGQKKVEKVTQS